MSIGARAAGVVQGFAEAGLDDMRVILHRDGARIVVESSGITVEHAPGECWEVAHELSRVVQMCASLEDVIATLADMHGEVLM